MIIIGRSRLVLPLILLLLSIPGEPQEAVDLETSGDLAGAGYAYEVDGDMAGVCRVKCRLLEEALYAGHVNRAQFLITEMSSAGVSRDYIRFWWARLSWSCGLPELAIAGLDEVSHGSPDDNWLALRSLGLAQLYSGAPDSAAVLLEQSLEAASTNWRWFYSAVDLCMALLQSGDRTGASLLSARILEMFPWNGLAMVLRGVVDVSAGSPSAAFTYWSRVAGDPGLYGVGPASMADRLILEYE